MGEDGWSRGTGGGMAFNRPSSSPIGVGIDHGTIVGRGAGGARFRGEGVVNLPRLEYYPPFTVGAEIRGTQKRLAFVAGGLVNNIPVTSLDSTGNIDSGDGGFIYLDVKSSAGSVEEVEAKLGSGIDFKQTPQEGEPPGSLKIPIYNIRGNLTSYVLKRIIGFNNISIYPVATTWEYEEPDGCGAVAKIKYTWAVFS